MAAIETIDVKVNWATVGEVFMGMLNGGLLESAKLKATPDEFITAANMLQLHCVRSGLRDKLDVDDPVVVADHLRMVQKLFTNEVRNGLVPMSSTNGETVN